MLAESGEIEGNVMKFFIETYGCQMNVSDSELISTILIEAGHEPVTSIDQADLILFNTCSVREHAEQRVLGRISNEQHRKSLKPGLKIGVLGCMAQRIGNELLRDKMGIDFVIGVDQYHKIPELLAGELEESNLSEQNSAQLYPGFIAQQPNKTCGMVTIMRGCDNFCSYCIVPYVRGRERSRVWKDIYQEVELAATNGIRDITLLGQNVNSYHDGNLDFPDLLTKLSEIKELWRIRFITSHPKDLSDKLITAMASLPAVCEHIHLPLQSGNDRILNLMNRKYAVEDYLKLISSLRKAMPAIGITTDLIAGFPGESEVEFQDTLQAMKDIQYDYAFCFKYSTRSGTAAAEYSGQVSEEDKLRRLQTMIDLQRQITLSKYQAMIDKEVEVYVEDFSRKSNNQVSGKTRDFKIAVLNGDASMIGTLVKAKVTDATAGTLKCY